MKRNIWRAAAAVLAAALVAVIPACGGSGGGGSGRAGKVRVAIVTNVADPFWDICQAGAVKGAADFDLDVTFKQPAEMVVKTQMDIVDDLTKVGIKGLAVSVINPKEQTPKLKAIAQDLPLNNFLTMDNDAPESGRLCYVGVDNYEAGKEVGRMVKATLPNGGTLALFIGSTDSDNGVKRVAGVLSELAGKDVRSEVAAGKYEAKYGGFTLHRSQPITDGGDKNKAAANAGDTLEQLKGTPNLVFVGLYAYNPAKILEAARTKGMAGKVKIIGFDEDTVTLDGIDKGEIVGSVSQDPYNYGYETVKWLRHTIDGKDKKQLPQDPTPFSLVTKDGGAPVKRTVSVNGVQKEIEVKQRKASEYSKLVQDAYAAAKAAK
ncbi:MAG: substrate-binding domain-containing protein [Fimbriiglobus sp.]|nr:substrate-binding domain-containing protein [Fimbriiglobus sp.]